jgi:hypothetical protein
MLHISTSNVNNDRLQGHLLEHQQFLLMAQDDSRLQHKRICASLSSSTENGCQKITATLQTAASVSTANVCGVQDSRCIHVLFKLTSLYSECNCVQAMLVALTRLGRMFPAKGQSGFLKVLLLPPRQVVHLLVALEGVARCRCRWQ